VSDPQGPSLTRTSLSPRRSLYLFGHPARIARAYRQGYLRIGRRNGGCFRSFTTCLCVRGSGRHMTESEVENLRRIFAKGISWRKEWA